MNDHELLQRYATSRCEAAFTELVKRYVDLVYSAALRQVGGDAHLAEDVAQAVFIDLARKAASLPHRAVLAGWLYTGTRYAAAKTVRCEQRWRIREQKDTRFEFSLSGTDSHSVNKTEDALEAAATAYANANNGLLPREASAVAPYLQQGIDPVRVQRFLAQIPPGITTLEQAKNLHR